MYVSETAYTIICSSLGVENAREQKLSPCTLCRKIWMLQLLLDCMLHIFYALK